MLERVRFQWVTNVLQKSLYARARIELGIDPRPDAVQLPSNLIVQRYEEPPRSVSTGIRASQLFKEMNGRLLILGPPGAGKTTFLLELANDLLKIAEEDQTLRIPAVFNLSTWMVGTSIDQWLTKQLQSQYGVPPKLSQAWVENDQVLPLLDGLDELTLEARSRCIEAINEFLTNHLAHVCVCSRAADYEETIRQLEKDEQDSVEGIYEEGVKRRRRNDTSEKLSLDGAVLIKPLTKEQVNNYLEQAEGKLAGVRQALREDLTLWELLDSPLMLNIVAIAYQEVYPTVLRERQSLEVRRERLFSLFTDTMLTRRASRHYTTKQLRRWLMWLASCMTYHSQTVFSTHSIRADWIPQAGTRRTIVSSLGMIVGPTIGLLAGITTGLVCGFILSTDVGLAAGLAVAVVVIVSIGLFADSYDYSGGVMITAGSLFAGCVVVFMGQGFAPAIGAVAISGVCIFIAAILVGALYPLSDYLATRVMMVVKGYGPWNYHQFLDEVTRLVLMRKVGNRYIFIHRMVQDHLAAAAAKAKQR